MTKAYLIMAHKNPRQLFRLVTRLNDGSSHFFIHIDSKADLSTFEELNNLDNLTYLQRYNARWGRYGIVMPLLAGLKKTQTHEFVFDRIIVLSGQDYPIKSNKTINKVLSESPSSIYIDFTPLPDFERWPGADRGGLYRIDKYYFGDRWHERISSRALNLMASYVKVFRRKKPLQMIGYAGSAWMVLDMEAAKYILNFHENHPEYLKFHKDTFVADEVFIHMIIGNSKNETLHSRISNANQHFMIWETPESAHPKLFSIADFEKIAVSKHLFARKFDDTIDSLILDKIDSDLLRKSSIDP